MRVYNTSITSANNGGQCCRGLHPGVTWVFPQIWGGGGPGAGVCCCQQGWAGGSGSYARRIITASAGDQFTLCAAGSTCWPPKMLSQRIRLRMWTGGFRHV